MNDLLIIIYHLYLIGNHGYGSDPSKCSESNPKDDFVVILWDALPGTKGGAPQNKGFTLVHMWYTGLDCMIHTTTVVLDVAILFMILLQTRPEIWIIQQPFIAAVTLISLLRL